MHEHFHSLTPEKQGRIINAALAVFSQSPYGKASTDDMVALAGISKGSLFYYFRNKKDLYCYLYSYSCRIVYKKIDEQRALEETDFFDRNLKIAEARVCALTQHPNIFDFMLRAYYETDPAVAEDIHAINQKMLEDALPKLNENTDMSRFRDPADIGKAVKMLLWIGDGFIREKKSQSPMDLQQVQAEIAEYVEILRKGFYR